MYTFYPDVSRVFYYKTIYYVKTNRCLFCLTLAALSAEKNQLQSLINLSFQTSYLKIDRRYFERKHILPI